MTRWLGRLSPAEELLWAAFPGGEQVDLRTGNPEIDDIGNANQWPDHRRVRAEIVAALLRGAHPAVAGRAAGIRLVGAQLVGDLDLRHSRIAQPFVLRECVLDQVRLHDTEAHTIDLRRCRMTAFSAVDGRIAGRLDLRETVLTGAGAHRYSVYLSGGTVESTVRLSRSVISSGVRLSGTVVGGGLVLDHAVISGVDGVAIGAGRLRVGRDLYAPGLIAHGEIRLRDAQVGGGLVLDGATLRNPQGVALSAPGIRTTSDLHAGLGVEGEPFTCEGSIDLIGAHIGGGATFARGRIDRPGGIALDAGGLVVQRGLHLAGADITGATCLRGIQVGGTLDLSGARLENPGGEALSAEAATIRSDVRAAFLDLGGVRRPFTAEGGVRLSSATIGGDLALTGARLHAGDGKPVLDATAAEVARSVRIDRGFATADEIRFAGARIGRRLAMTGMACPKARLNLFGARITEIDDTPGGWPGRVNLDSLTYDTLNPYRRAAERIQILARQDGGYRAHPYEELARHYRRLGHDDEARDVLLAKLRARRRTRSFPRRIPGYLADLLAGYGYRTRRTVAWALGLLVLGSCYFWQYPATPIRPGQTQPFYPVLYTADLIIPVLRISQQDVWVSYGFSAYVASTLTAMGWVLGIAIAAGATRAITRN